MSTLFRALLEGFGWHVGKAAAREALDAAERALAPEPAAPPADPKKLEADAKEQAKRVARDTKERAAAQAREQQEIDAELKALKKRLRG